MAQRASRSWRYRTGVRERNHHHVIQVYEVALELAAALPPLLRQIEVHDRDLAEQIRRAATATIQAICEGRKRTRADRANRFRCANGEADEIKGSLRGAVALEYLPKAEIAAAHDLADRVCAMSYRLSKKP